MDKTKWTIPPTVDLGADAIEARAEIAALMVQLSEEQTWNGYENESE